MKRIALLEVEPWEQEARVREMQRCCTYACTDDIDAIDAVDLRVRANRADESSAHPFNVHAVGLHRSET